MAVEVADDGSALASGALQLFDATPGAPVGGGVDGLGHQIDKAGAHLLVGEQDLGAEVVDHGVGRAAAAQGTTSLPLAQAEEALYLVGRGGQAGIIEAMEEVGAVAAGHRDEVVDEGGGLGVEPQAGCRALELAQEVPQLGLSRGGILWTAGPVRGRVEVVGYVSEVLHVSLDPAGDTDLMPVQAEGLREGIKAGRGHGCAGRVFFCAAVWTALRTCSRRW